jgi:hypothetical protein
LIRPTSGDLKFAEGKLPTPLGPILVSWKAGNTFTLALTLPTGVKAKLELPATTDSRGVLSSGTPVSAHRVGSRWVLDADVAGTATFEVK